MLGQNIGTKYLLPLARDKLEVDPLAEGGYCPGYLLGIVLKLSTDSIAAPEYFTRLMALLKGVKEIPEEIEEEYEVFFKRNA